MMFINAAGTGLAPDVKWKTKYFYAGYISLKYENDIHQLIYMSLVNPPIYGTPVRCFDSRGYAYIWRDYSKRHKAVTATVVRRRRYE